MPQRQNNAPKEMAHPRGGRAAPKDMDAAHALAAQLGVPIDPGHTFVDAVELLRKAQAGGGSAAVDALGDKSLMQQPTPAAPPRSPPTGPPPAAPRDWRELGGRANRQLQIDAIDTTLPFAEAVRLFQAAKAGDEGAKQQLAAADVEMQRKEDVLLHRAKALSAAAPEMHQMLRQAHRDAATRK